MNKLKLGVGRTDITPEIGGNLYGYNPDTYSESIHDNLRATAFVFKYNNITAVMISVEVCLINTTLAYEIRKTISENHNIPLENILISATHTHSGPNTCGQLGWGDIDKEYCDKIFIPQILSAVDNAFKKTVPVKTGCAYGNSYVGINRRELREDNIVVLGQQPWGCFNPKMTVLSFKDESGDTVANIIHYGAHGTAAGLNHEITRDWSGIMLDCIETVSGGITAFFNGFEGDVGPRLSNKKTVGNIHYVEELGKIAANDALRIYNQISEFNDCEVNVISGTLNIPYKPRIPLAEAKSGIKKYEGSTINFTAQSLRYFENIVKSYKEEYIEKNFCEIPQSAIAIGNNIFIGFSYEVFSEIGLRIQKAIPDKNILPLSNTNGSEGYFPTQDQLCLGGYEIEMFKTSDIQTLVDNADWYLMTETVKNIQSKVR